MKGLAATVLPPIVFVTGTDTDVGKTIATATLAAVLAHHQKSVAVYKPAQTGARPGDIADMDVVGQLAGIESVSEGIRLPDPMAPVAAAARSGMTLPRLENHIRRIEELSRTCDHIVVEGAGGLLVELDPTGRTLADLAAAFGGEATTIVVCRSGLGTLNHTQLTIEALLRRGIPIAGLIIGSWPQHPDDIALSNRDYLESLAVPLIGCLPENAATLSPTSFRLLAAQWLAGVTARSSAQAITITTSRPEP